MDFGKHKELKLNINSDLNILYGPNEAGKSTIQAFIKVMLYGINSRARKIVENERLKYTPWDGSAMSGEIIIEKNGIDYSIRRTFGESKKHDKIKINNVITGEPVPLKSNEEPGEWLLNMTQGTFENTVFIKQLSPFIESSKEKSGEILSRLSSLASSGEEETSVKLIDHRLKKSMDSLHSPRRDRGIIDKLIEEKNNLTDELNKFYALKTSTAERLEIINNLKKKKAELQENIKVLENRKIDLENSKTITDWKEILELSEKKNEYITSLNNLYDSVTFEGEIINRTKLERMKDLFQKYNESIQTLSVIQDNYIEAQSTVFNLEKEVESKSMLENIDFAHMQKLSTDMANLENIGRQRDGIKEKINSIENEIKAEEEKYNQILNSDKEKSPSAAFYLVLAVLCIIIAGIGFIRPNIIFIIPGVIGFLASLSLLLSNKKRQVSESRDLEMKQKEILESIENKKATMKIYQEQLEMLFKSSLYDITCDNLDDNINEIKNLISNTLSAAGCPDLSALENALTDFKALKLRLKDAQRNLNNHKKRYLEAKNFSNKRQEEFYLDFHIIGIYTDRVKIKNKLNEISEQLDKIETLKNNLEHVKVLIKSKLRGRDIDDLREKALRIDAGFVPCEYTDDLYAEVTHDIDFFNKELNNVNQDIIKENGIISSAFKGVRSEEELVPLIDEITEQINEYEYYYSCLELARNVLNESFEEMQKSFGPVLNEETARIFNYTTNNKYSDVYINKDFNIMLNADSDFSLRESDYLSMGTMDQLYFSLRVAIANLISDGDRPLPLFLDDTFVQYDEDRVRRVLDFIFRESSNRQIFIFTCHERVISYLQEKYEDKDLFKSKVINI